MFHVNITRMSVVLASFAIVGAFFSCSVTSTYDDVSTFTYETFNDVIPLKAEPLNIENLTNPYRIRLIDSMLLIVNLRSDKLISVYNLKNNSKLGDFLSSGKAENELLYAEFIEFFEKTGHFWLHDISSKKTLVYDIADLQTPNLIHPSKVISFNGLMDNTLLLSSNKILALAIGYDAKERIFVLDSCGTKIEDIGSYPKLADKEETYGLPYIYDSRCVVNQDESMIAIFNKNTDLIEIYNVHNKSVRRFHGPDQFIPEYRINKNTSISLPEGKARNGYFQPIDRGGILWVLYSGQFIERPNSNNKILSFDWAGNPLNVYECPYSLVSFDVDAKNKLIYGLSLVDGEPKIFIFRY